jgi:transcriptional regulator with XRE-family HTH domain
MGLKTIKELREAKGWSPVKLAAELNVSLATVYNWESGKFEPRASMLRSIAETFDVPMDVIEFPVDDDAKKAAA